LYYIVVSTSYSTILFFSLFLHGKIVLLAEVFKI